MLIFYIIINKESSDTINTGIAIGAQYLIKSKKLNLTCSSFNILIHIIPASAPIGVKYAPMLEPMIEA